MRTIIYVSGALTDLPETARGRFLAFYDAVGELIERMGLTAYVPHRNTDPVRHKDVTPGEVDMIDRRAVTSAALVIAVVDHPSLGVGGEIEMAHHAHKPVVLLFEKARLDARRISRLTRGNPAVVHEIVYRNQSDALSQLEMFIAHYLEGEERSILPPLLQVRTKI